MGDIERAGALAAVARDYIVCAECIRKDLDSTKTRIPDGEGFGFYFLMAHAAEVILKAHLLLKGLEYKKLTSRKYGHDLNELISECDDKNVPLSEGFKRCIGLLAGNHKDYTYRYLEADEKGRIQITRVDNEGAMIEIWKNSSETLKEELKVSQNDKIKNDQN